MDRTRLIEENKKRLPIHRFEHVLRVAHTAVELADRFGLSVEKAEKAALIHDIAKFMEPVKLRKKLEESEHDERLLHYHHELWHAPVGAMIAEEEFGVTDEDVLNAIRYHTTGRAGMSDIEKVIYIADLIEPNRQFPGVEQLRTEAEKSLEESMKACIIHSVQYLVSKQVPVFPDSFECYNEYVLSN
ncbi:MULTISPECIES: bis(5'-nucleosyl)-tetraphosphatase (symmetrical) YqeK [Sporosarcina]|uniref:bis(5'-nucleosyl)-tetraphosphatase (symmetrical) n=1 Tax=Sporosarcina contaminans TaxID=633403 RepID=A0ABW3U1T1_9BACL